MQQNGMTVTCVVDERVRSIRMVPQQTIGVGVGAGQSQKVDVACHEVFGVDLMGAAHSGNNTENHRVGIVMPK